MTYKSVPVSMFRKFSVEAVAFSFCSLYDMLSLLKKGEWNEEHFSGEVAYG
jgi:hypothetical protein